MDVSLEKIKLTKLLLNTDNPKILKAVKQLLVSDLAVDFWDDLSEEHKEVIHISEKQFETGEYSSYNSFMEKHR